jgi:hypothetical protein
LKVTGGFKATTPTDTTKYTNTIDATNTTTGQIVMKAVKAANDQAILTLKPNNGAYVTIDDKAEVKLLTGPEAEAKFVPKSKVVGTCPGVVRRPTFPTVRYGVLNGF